MAVRKYLAFISYSHADRAAGARLFARIDGFRPPKSLVGSDGAFGPVPAKLYPCFRDREELSSSPDVKASLDAALNNADHLVVLCSPNAAKSAWIDHEVRSFAASHGIDRIHVVLASDEPKAALPAALADVGLTNPLAADLRDHADGWVDGPLKTIASILGVAFGDLRDREAARTRARRRSAITISALVSTVFLGGCGAGWVALERNESLQRAFIDVMREISARSVRALDEQGVTLTTAEIAREIEFTDVLTRTAFGLAPNSPLLVKEEMRLAVVHARHLMSIGSSAEALAAAEHTDALCSRQPLCQHDPEARLLQATSLRTQAAIVLLSTRDQDADNRLHESEALILNQTDPDSRRELALTYQAMGALEERRANLHQAASRYGQAAEILRELRLLGAVTREQRHDEIVLLGALGDAALGMGRYEQARVYYAGANALAAQLQAETPDLQARRTLYVTHDRLGLLALQAGDGEEALRQFDLAQTLVAAHIERDPDNIEMRRDLVVARLQGARAQALTGHRDRAIAQAEIARDEARNIAARDPADVRLATDLSRAEILLEWLRSGGDLREPVDINGVLTSREALLAAALGIELDPQVAEELRRQRFQRMRPRPNSPAVSAPP